MGRGVNGNDHSTHQMFLKEHIPSSIRHIDIASTALESQRPNANVKSVFAFDVFVASIQADFTLILLSQHDKNTGRSWFSPFYPQRSCRCIFRTNDCSLSG